MRRNALSFAIGFLILSGAAVAPLPGQTPSFDLSLSAPAAVEGTAGAAIQYEATARLTTSGLPDVEQGAQAWSLSLSADGAGRIVGVTTAGTAVEALSNDGFEKTELTAGAGNEGAVSAVVLSLTLPITLPPIGTSDILRLTIEATVPDPVPDEAGDPSCEPALSRVVYVDGRKGSGQPVDNRVTWRGETFIPTKGEATTSICPLVVKPVVMRVEVEGGAPGAKAGKTRPWKIDVPVGSGMVPVTADIVLASTLPDDPNPDVQDGAQGWSISVPTDACFNISGVTTAGTAVDTYFSGGFLKTEIVDPARNSGQQGAVSAVVLSFTLPRNLPPVSENLILKVSGSIDASGIAAPGDMTSPPCNVRVADGEPFLRGAGQPVKTAVTVAGATRTPGVCDAALQLSGAREGRFVRGNANDDMKNDIADAIWIVNEIFRSGPPTLCRDAADSNDDGAVDLSDALYIIGYQFQGQAPPPAPFPDCGTDPSGDSDGLTCDQTQTRC